MIEMPLKWVLGLGRDIEKRAQLRILFIMAFPGDFEQG